MAKVSVVIEDKHQREWNSIRDNEKLALIRVAEQMVSSNRDSHSHQLGRGLLMLIEQDCSIKEAMNWVVQAGFKITVKRL